MNGKSTVLAIIILYNYMAVCFRMKLLLLMPYVEDKTGSSLISCV